jgi:hypothetical protein
MRNFQPVSRWRREHPGVRALLLENAFGHKLLLRASDPLPVGRYALLGVIE